MACGDDEVSDALVVAGQGLVVASLQNAKDFGLVGHFEVKLSVY